MKGMAAKESCKLQPYSIHTGGQVGAPVQGEASSGDEYASLSSWLALGVVSSPGHLGRTTMRPRAVLARFLYHNIASCRT